MNDPQTPVIDPPSRWARPAGYRDILRVAGPLVLSTSCWTIQNFVDRMFLSWYDADAMAAALPAGLLAFTFICLLMGTAGYANVFVAQYHGAGQDRRIGAAIWQAAWFSLATGLMLPIIGLAGGAVFRWSGHAAALQALETNYFRISMIGGIFTIYNNALISLYSGRGRNWPILWVNIVITIVNIALDYCLIFGNFGFPRWGIAGAAWATTAGIACGSAIFSWMVFLRANERDFGTRSGWRLDPALMRRLLRFGLPSGAQFMLDLLAFTIFTMLVGRIGSKELAASNVALQINMLAFMPMIGGGIAIQSLVGQWLGRDRPDLAARATWSAFHLGYGYMVFFAILYLAVPSFFLEPFVARADAAAFAEIRPMAITILRFVAIYCLFDMMTIVFSSALKGAGDTRFVMFYALTLGWTLMVLPTWIAVEHFHAGVLTAWAILTVYVSLTATGFLLRFLQGKWRAMRVIEPVVVEIPATLAPMPTVEVEL